MSIDGLFPVVDTHVSVGVMAEEGKEKEKTPFILVDFGAEHPSLLPYIARNKVIVLDIVPSHGQCTLHIIGNRKVIELTSSLLTRGLAAAPEDMEAVLFAGAQPEFATSITLSQESCNPFIEVRQTLGGYWMLMLLAVDAVIAVIAPSGQIVRCSTVSREQCQFLKM